MIGVMAYSTARRALAISVAAATAIVLPVAISGAGEHAGARAAGIPQNPKCEVLPAADEFHRDVSAAAVHPRSRQIIDRINSTGGETIHPDFGSRREWGIPYIVVPSDQERVPVRIRAYPDESDKGPHPIPRHAPVEGGSRSDGDRHVLVVRKPRRAGGSCKLVELYRAFYKGGAKRKWVADAAAVFDLGRRLPQRPERWTSADAAGLPIFPGLIRFGEVARGEINHAIRFTVERTRQEYVLPATHWASDSCHPDDPPMGLRMRLKAGYDLSGFSAPARVIGEAMKTYGLILADNGSNWFMSGATDRRWKDGPLSDLKQIPSSALEVVTSPGKRVSDC